MAVESKPGERPARSSAEGDAEVSTDALARTATLAASQPATVGDELPAGLRLGHFRIDRKLGAGGMGEVYLATDLALDRPVAIKVLPAGFATSGDARDRLVREARAQARIQHPNVAHIYFIGEDAGRLYFAMEYLAGETLGDRAAKGPLSVEDALGTIRAAALGLREAQRNGFTHRDVKPSNLMADAHGVVKVLDFGLVGAVPEAATGPDAQTSLAGTPLYMAPEQAKGQPIDLRADIYALGATLFHLVSGKPPFAADTVDGLITMHATAARPHVPRKGPSRPAIAAPMAAAINRLVARMMAPEPADRFASYDDLIRELELVSIQHTRPAGAWVRAIAALIDVAIVTLLAVIITLPFGGGGNIDGYKGNGLFFVYATVLLARFGTTPGKALLELEVVGIHDGRKPSLTRAFVREVTMFGPTMLLSALGHYVAFGFDTDIIVLAVFVLTVLSLFVAAWRVPGKRAPWDRVAGTQVRYRVPRRPTAALLP
ncbi:MAG: protein kinase [Kofleriaceae bacterium]